jgi:hypothetical protein
VRARCISQGWHRRGLRVGRLWPLGRGSGRPGHGGGSSGPLSLLVVAVALVSAVSVRVCIGRGVLPLLATCNLRLLQPQNPSRRLSVSSVAEERRLQLRGRIPPTA